MREAQRTALQGVRCVMKTARDREEFCWFMGREGYPLDLCRKLMKEAATYQRLAEAHCSREMKAIEQTRWEACKRRIGLLVVHAAAGKNFQAIFQNDPRGACVKLRLPSGRGNDFGGEGLLCVPA